MDHVDAIDKLALILAIDAVAIIVAIATATYAITTAIRARGGGRG